MNVSPEASDIDRQSRNVFRELLRSNEELQESLKTTIAQAFVRGHRAGRWLLIVRRIAFGAIAFSVALGFLDAHSLALAPILVLACCGAVYLYILWDKSAYPARQAAQFANRLAFDKLGGKWVVKLGPQSQKEPPRAAEFIIALLAKAEHREACIGDADEKYQRDLARYGRERARLMYWTDAIKSVWPLVRQRLRRLSITGILIAIATIAFGR